MKKVAKEMVGSNLASEAVSFTFPLKSSGVTMGRHYCLWCEVMHL